MKLKNLIVVALLLAIGTILHALVPGFPMKSDFGLVMLFISLFLFTDLKSFLIIGLVDGILAGLTTTMPGGFIPNVVDKLITSTVVFLVFYLIARHLQPKATYIFGVVLAGLGTMLSGTIFLTVAILVAGLNTAAFGGLFVTMVLPTALANLLLFAVLYPIIVKIGERSGFLHHTAPRPTTR
ncbi:tryptophan transporter [Sporolactobacillus terrae]|uniref:Putative tryptophan transport protein n=1 Tax=Sporolactobacillus terrae TaxID=269673 RepID=A0A410DAG0_9BACL|nr:tryptophan transporter [Sporolactobacillus terrae]QAA23099.1 tryptophan transporter [Sporolactobacillus terrae]QAA26071.1 tryptophan transporter [Sporolactobacillus terrae]UAK15165.1 tryptophan transporter [Sporolactobacillus terrae]BBN99512.1 putative tryptophan transport protein [Sporolactobacillus terrae]